MVCSKFSNWRGIIHAYLMVLLSNQSFELGILQMKLYCVQSQYALHNI